MTGKLTTSLTHEMFCGPLWTLAGAPVNCASNTAPDKPELEGPF